MIQLARFQPEDFDRLISWMDSEELLVQVAGPIFTYPLTSTQLVTYLEDDQRYAFKVIETHSGEVIGHAEIYKTKEHSAKICRVLIGDQSFRGKGIGKELIKQLVDYSIAHLNINFVELNVYDWNTAAIKCYEKVGFVINPDKFTTIEVKENTWISLNMIFRG